MSNTSTPPQINQNVLRLCQQMGLSDNPVYVPVRPSPSAQVNECFPSVEKFIKDNGGKCQIGWTIWEWPSVFMEAEFHAVWVSPSNEFVDITPKINSEERILFLPDSAHVYTGYQVDNVRMALRDDQIVRDYIRLAESRYAVMNRGDRAGKHGYVSVPENEIIPLIQMGQMLEYMLVENIRRTHVCPCGSGVKYKKCHEPVIEDLVRSSG